MSEMSHIGDVEFSKPEIFVRVKVKQMKYKVVQMKSGQPVIDERKAWREEWVSLDKLKELVK